MHQVTLVEPLSNFGVVLTVMISIIYFTVNQNAVFNFGTVDRIQSYAVVTINISN